MRQSLYTFIKINSDQSIQQQTNYQIPLSLCHTLTSNILPMILYTSTSTRIVRSKYTDSPDRHSLSTNLRAGTLWKEVVEGRTWHYCAHNHTYCALVNRVLNSLYRPSDAAGKRVPYSHRLHHESIFYLCGSVISPSAMMAMECTGDSNIRRLLVPNQL